MRQSSRLPVVLVLLMTVSACGGGDTVESPNVTTGDSTSISTPTTGTPATTVTQPISTTTSTSAEPSTSTTPPQASAAADSCSSPLLLDTATGPPAISLLPPSPETVLVSDVNEYYSWRDAVGADSYTLRFTGTDTGDDLRSTLIVLQMDGASQHIVASELGGEVSELIIVGDDIWTRTDDEDWSTIDEIGHLARLVLAPISADLWYSVAHETLSSTEFKGWAQVDGTDVAVFSGGSTAAQIAADALGITQPIPDGELTLMWDPAGFFRSVGVTFANEYGERSNCWTVTDIDETTVEPPT